MQLEWVKTRARGMQDTTGTFTGSLTKRAGLFIHWGLIENKKKEAHSVMHYKPNN